MPVSEKERGAGVMPAPAQELAIEHAFGPIQVLAGPGSGKTYLTIRRIRHLICHHGISPDKILVITFTKAAASEMQERFIKLTEGEYQGVCFGTFHAVYFQILKQSGYGMEKLTPASGSDKWNYLEHSLKLCGIHDMDRELAGNLLKEISRVKQNGGILKLTAAIGRSAQEDELLSQNFSAVYEEYCSLMREEKKLDFDDMIFLCDKLLEESEKVRSCWENRFSHILVDEFQDISPLQYQVLKKLTGPEQNIFVVGDDDQSIYGFRGAGPDIMKQFLTDYPKAVQVTLEYNYRSTEMIVNAALTVIAENKNRFYKQLKASRLSGPRPVLRAFASKEEEVSYLLTRLSTLSKNEQDNTAIICRTNLLLEEWSRYLTAAGITFTCRDRLDNLFEHFISMDFLAYLKCARDFYENGQVSRKDFLRIMNKPGRYIRRGALVNEIITPQLLSDYYSGKSYMQERIAVLWSELLHLAKLRPYLAIDYIRKVIGYNAVLKEKVSRSEYQYRMKMADEIQQTALKYRTYEEWMAYIDMYTAMLKEITPVKKCGIKLATMHGSKGLEYDNVFLPDMTNKVMPNRKAHTPQQLEEERRIFYVAMTRARNYLEICYDKEPSPFLSKLVHSPYIELKGSGSYKV